MQPLLRPTWLKQKSLLPWLPRTTPQNFVPLRIATTSVRNAAPVDVPKIVITAGSQKHNSLPSFLKYARRTRLPPLSTVFVGTHYEYVSALALQRLGFSLLRVGRRFDAGIDLIGHWVLAPLREPLPVIIQCKVRQLTASPMHIRELEGSFQGVPPIWRNKAVLGLLVTTKKATKGVLEAMGKSHWPMGFLLISQEGTIQQFLWNRAASERGLEGVSVTVRHTPRAHLPEFGRSNAGDGGAGKKERTKPAARFQNSGTEKDIQLTWMGSPIFPDRGDVLDRETVKLMGDVVNETTAYVGKERKKMPALSTKELKAAGIVASAQILEPKDDMRGRPPTLHMEPDPRGGEVDPRLLCMKPPPRDVGPKKPPSRDVGPKKRGRPPGSVNEPRIVKTRRGRPPGALNKIPARGRKRATKTDVVDKVDSG